MLSETLKVVWETGPITALSGSVSGHQGSNVLLKYGKGRASPDCKLKGKKKKWCKIKKSFVFLGIIQTKNCSQLGLILILNELTFYH